MKLRKQQKSRGFTLVEILLVVTILAVITAGAIFYLSPTSNVDNANKVALEQILIGKIPTAILQYKLNNNNSLTGFKLHDGGGSVDDYIDSWPGINKSKTQTLSVAADKVTIVLFPSDETAATGIAAKINSMLGITGTWDATAKSITIVYT